MLQKIIYAETNAYDLIIAIDGDAVRYTDDVLLDTLERETGRDIFGLPRLGRAQAVFAALADPDADVSGWALAEDEGLTLADLLDGVRVIAEWDAPVAAGEPVWVVCEETAELPVDRYAGGDADDLISAAIFGDGDHWPAKLCAVRTHAEAQAELARHGCTIHPGDRVLEVRAAYAYEAWLNEDGEEDVWGDPEIAEAVDDRRYVWNIVQYLADLSPADVPDPEDRAALVRAVLLASPAGDAVADAYDRDAAIAELSSYPCRLSLADDGRCEAAVYTAELSNRYRPDDVAETIVSSTWRVV